MKDSTKNYLMFILNIIIATVAMDLVSSVCVMSLDMFMGEKYSVIIGSILGTVLTVAMWYWQGWRFGNADYVEIYTFKNIKNIIKRQKFYV